MIKKVTVSFKATLFIVASLGLEFYKSKAPPLTLDPGCLEAFAMASRAAGPRAVVPTAVSLPTEKSGEVKVTVCAK